MTAVRRGSSLQRQHRQTQAVQVHAAQAGQTTDSTRTAWSARHSMLMSGFADSQRPLATGLCVRACAVRVTVVPQPWTHRASHDEHARSTRSTQRGSTHASGVERSGACG